ncbi:MAG: pectin acetylesterase-family hydrolase [Lachnospiraceae bacterium]|jgi:hypothetical protein|nr:pectin acetylesterase-family hydrolase [Lachnospiraceae bacterium]MCI1328464.1 pectin acetylesterase-family hydrolase [Lachnospiraceae bacterium]
MARHTSKKNEPISYRVGNYVEQAIGNDIERRFEAPVLADHPKKQFWYRRPVEGAMAGDGSEYHLYVKFADPSRLCVFLSGGGVAWNEYTAARPATGGKIAAGLPNYYWNNLRPFTQIMNINTGITEIGNPHNPFDGWSFLVITYATGDFHVGSRDFPYAGEDGREKILHFHGHKNFRLAMDLCAQYFPDPRKILIAGDSAGAFAVPALAEEILEDYYPETGDVTLLSDCGQLCYDKWRRTARDVWGAPERIWKPIRGENLTVEWFRSCHAKLGDRIRYLYSASVRDYLLSAYLSDMTRKVYRTDAEFQEKFFEQSREMIRDLKEITSRFGIFLYDWKNHRFHLGGTVHTAVRHRRFYFKGLRPASMAQWLIDGAEGRIYDIGMDLLKSGREKNE